MTGRRRAVAQPRTGPGEPAAKPAPRRRLGRAAAVGLALAGASLVALALWSAAGGARAATPSGSRGGSQFSNYIDDLPIMPGLVENDTGYSLDLDQGGRVAESRLAGEAEAAVVRGFYAATLSQLGWKASQAEPYVYHRGREILTFRVEPRKLGRGSVGRGLEAVFVVAPMAVEVR